MRNLLLILAVTAISASGLTSTTAFASSCPGAVCKNSIPRTFARPIKKKVRTCVVNRCTRTHHAKGTCGRTYSYQRTVVTYRDVYSDGSTRTWQRTI